MTWSENWIKKEYRPFGSRSGETISRTDFVTLSSIIVHRLCHGIGMVFLFHFFSRFDWIGKWCRPRRWMFISINGVAMAKPRHLRM